MVKTQLAVERGVHARLNFVNTVNRESQRLPLFSTPTSEQLEGCLRKVRNPRWQPSGRDASGVNTVKDKNAEKENAVNGTTQLMVKVVNKKKTEKGNTVNGQKQSMVKTVNGKNAASCEISKEECTLW